MAFNIQGAIQAGYKPEEIQAYLQSKNQGQATVATNPTPQETLPKSQGFDFASLLPIIGAIGGSFIPGLGNIVGGALGAGAGTLLKQGIKGEGDLGEVAKETALGGVGGVLGKGLGAVGGKLLGKVGQGVADTGENLALRAIRPTKTQLANFSKKHGVDLGEYITTKNPLTGTDLIGKTGQQIGEEVIQPLQDTFSQIVKNTNVPVDETTLIRKFSEKIAELRNTGSTEDLKVADDLLKEAKTVLSQLRKTGNSLDEVNKMRINFDKKVNNWLGNPVEAGRNRLTGSVLREAVQETADQAGLVGPNGLPVKELGLELSKLYSVKDIADLQANLGRGTLPLGLSNLLGIAAGGGVAGGLPGAAAGLGATMALNSPTVLRGLSKGATAAGGKMVQGLPQPVGGILAQGAGQGAARLSVPTGGEQTAIEGQLMGNFPEPANVSLAANQPEGASQDQTMRNLFLAMMLSNPKQAATLKTIYEFGFPQGKVSANQEKGYQKIADAESIAKQVEAEFKKVGGSGRVTGRVQELGGALGINPQTTAYNALREASIGPLARAISAEVGVLTDRDIARAEKLLPKITDTPQEASLKIKLLKEAIQARRANIKNTPKSVDSSLPMPADLSLY